MNGYDSDIRHFLIGTHIVFINQWWYEMEKVCGVIVFLSVYQLAGLNDFHDLPVLEGHHLSSVCTAVRNTIGWHGVC